MARGKKKETGLTPEGKLAQALVPDWEKPYHVPKNWIWSYIRSGYEVTSSKRVHKDDWLSEGVPFYRTRELVKLSEHGYVDNELFISEEQYEEYKTAYGVPQIGDLLISGVGTIGVPYIVDSEEKFYFKDGNIIWFKNRGLFLPKYIYFIYKSLFMDNQIHEMSSGTTVDTYTIINANNTMVPIPPLSEQQRIIDRIEYLFAKLDEAKEKTQSVLDSFETRKAAILHKAFTGELTAKWRTEHGINMTGWTHSCLGTYANSQYGYTESATTDPIGPHFLRITDIQDGQVDWSSVPYCKIDPEKKTQYAIQQGDIVVARTGATTGKSYLVIDDVDAVYASYLIRVSLKSDLLNNRYLHAFMQSPEYWRQISDFSSGIAQPGVNGKKLKELELPIPSVPEQKEIVRILDSLFAKEQQAKETAEAVLEKIDLLKKSILARTFRGELGTNDPKEESAVELLKAIL